MPAAFRPREKVIPWCAALAAHQLPRAIPQTSNVANESAVPDVVRSVRRRLSRPPIH